MLRGGDWATIALVSVWTETFLYGLYSTLHFQSMYIMLKGINGRSLSAKIFLWTAAFMYLIATAHVSLSLHLLLRRHRTPETGSTWFSAPKWEYRAYTGLSIIMMWIFDCLMIYRCYIIWSKQFSVIVAPIIVFLTSIILALLAWFSVTEGPLDMKKFKPLGHAVLPVNLFQNILTTGLICFRLVCQFRTSRASGIQPSHSRLNLFHVVRIILESAAIFTILYLITIIFYSIQSRIVWVLVGMNTPTIGITFSLISIRMNAVTSRAREPRSTLFTVSPWNRESIVAESQSENPLTPVGMKGVPGQ